MKRLTKDLTNPHKYGKSSGDAKKVGDSKTNFSRKTDGKSGYKHGSFSNPRKPK